MITGTTMVMGIIIIIMIVRAELCLVRRRRPAPGALPRPGEGLGERVSGKTGRPKPFTPSLALWEREPTESAARESLQ